MVIAVARPGHEMSESITYALINIEYNNAPFSGQWLDRACRTLEETCDWHELLA
jgi:hypothetical protein